MNNIRLPKKITNLIIISLFVSIFLVFFTYKYDKFESDNPTRSLVKGHAYPIWEGAKK